MRVTVVSGAGWCSAGSLARKATSAGLLLLLAACASTAPPSSGQVQVAALSTSALPVRHQPVTQIAEPKTFDLTTRTTESFRSKGQVVRVEVIRPQGAPEHRPAVVMLHGASGLGNGWLVFPHGEELARRGMDVFVVRYYDGLKGNDAAKASVALHDRREEIISDAIAFVAAQPGIDPSRIGVYGMSLGGFHALALGATDARIAAVANVMGAMPRQVPAERIANMPPTLLIHGARDRIVPISRMYEVASMLDTIGADYEIKVYLDQAHNLAGDAHPDSVLTVANFFDRQLNGAASTSVASTAPSSQVLTSLDELRPVVAPTKVAAAAARKSSGKPAPSASRRPSDPSQLAATR